MKFRCLSCDSELTTYGDKYPQTVCECGGYWADKKLYQKLFKEMNKKRDMDLLEDSDFEEYVKKEVEQFKKTDLYVKLNEEFKVEEKRLISELRNSYIQIDSWLVNDYIILFEIHPEDIENTCVILKQDKLNFFIVNNYLVLFLDSLITHKDKVRFSELFRNHFDTRLDEYENDRIVPELFKSNVIPQDLLGLHTIPTNHIIVEHLEEDKRRYNIKPSKKRILLI